METNKSHRRSRIGRVIADKTDKTIKVEIEGTYMHPKYKKFIKRRTSFMVHDPEEICKLGDIVRVEQCRPVSKSKKWIVREVVSRGGAKVVDTLKEAEDDSTRVNA